MIDDNKIEAAKEEIYEDRFLLNGEEIVFNNDEKEEMFYKEDIKEAIGLGAKWAINEFLKDLWHPSSEKPEKRNENIIVLQDEDDEDESNPLYAAILHERHDTFPWDEYCEDNAIYKWCYFKEIAPKKGDKNE